MSNLLERLARRKTPAEDMQAEMKRRYTKRNELLRMFENKRVLTTKDLQRFGTGVSSRIFELRKAGHAIVPKYVSPGNFEYHYKGKK